MKKNWSVLKSNIPSKVKTRPKVHFDILWQQNLTDKSNKRLYGITHFNPNQIIIDINQSDKEACYTAFHEVLHAVCDSYQVQLTETQVRKLEKALPYLMDFFEQWNKK